MSIATKVRLIFQFDNNAITAIKRRQQKCCFVDSWADTGAVATTKGIRLNTVLRKRFEAFCRESLLDERAVIEAWLLRFLEATDEERKTAARRYLDWYQEESGETSAVTPDALIKKGPIPRKKLKP